MSYDNAHLAGRSQVSDTLVEPGDLLVDSATLDHVPAEKAGMVGRPIYASGTAYGNDTEYRVYRTMPRMSQGSIEKNPSTGKTYGEESPQDVVHHSAVEPKPVDTSKLPDSGKRTEFSTGAVRDASEAKGHFHCLPPVAMRKLAKRFEDGAAKYSRNNWMKGIPLSRYQDSLARHLLAFSEGDETEDHAGAIIWNACCMVWTDEEIKAGRLPKELDDLPYRNHQ